MIPAMPEFSEFGGEVMAEAGSFDTRRLGGHVNVPLGDRLAVRAAGMMTKRDGYDFNTFTNKRVNGRDLWSTRLSLAWEPTDNFRASFIWQHFEEDDNRSRTGKQLCTRDPGPTQIGDTTVPFDYIQAKLSQGCLDASLYDDAAFGAPNLLGSSQIFAAGVQIAGYDPDTGQPVQGFRSIGSLTGVSCNPVICARLRRVTILSFAPKTIFSS